MRAFTLRKKTATGTLFCYVFAEDEVQAQRFAIEDDPVWRDAEIYRGEQQEMLGCKRFHFVSDPCPTCGRPR